MSCLSCHASFRLWRRCLLKSMRIWRPRNWRGTWRKYSGKSVQPRHDRNLWNCAHLSASKGNHPDFFVGFWVLWSRARQMCYAGQSFLLYVYCCTCAWLIVCMGVYISLSWTLPTTWSSVSPPPIPCCWGLYHFLIAEGWELGGQEHL